MFCCCDWLVFCGSDPSCSFDTVNSTDWMQQNLGGFSVVVPFQDLQILYPQFSPVLFLFVCYYVCFFGCVWGLSRSSLFVWLYAVGSLVAAVAQTAGSFVRHTWPVRLSCPGQYGDELHPRPASPWLLRRLLFSYWGEKQIIIVFCLVSRKLC